MTGQMGSKAAIWLLTCATLCGAGAANAQSAEAQWTPATGADDIVVTARRRDETTVSAPVTLSAIGGAELRDRAISNLMDVSRVIPQLVIGNSQSVQGGSISLRGIGSSESNPFADQAVSFAMDGVQVARATVQRMAQMDLAQVAVFKGPQALFFGKNSPAGVIDIRSNDPTPHFDSRVALGYEFNGRELRGDGYVSGPLTETLGARLALYGSHLGGYAKNVTPNDGIIDPSRIRVPHDREFAGRLTLKFEPTDRFDARLKLSYNRLRTEGPAENQQLIDCPRGVGQVAPADDCRLDNRVVRPNLGPNFASIDPRYGDGDPYLKQNQFLAGLEMNYGISDALKLTSTSGFYRTSTKYRDSLNGAMVRAQLLANYQELKDTEFSQELRLASSFDYPVNFIVGGYYQHTKMYDVFIAAANADNPFSLFNNAATQHTNAWSAFGQISWDITDTLELAGGGRYSHERKKLAGEIEYQPVETLVPRRSFNDFSPEATLTWRPSETLTLYGSYKEGFLSGGFNVSAVDLRGDRSYEQQTVRGGEVGLKAALLDNDLRINIALYDYDLRGLQVQTQVGLTQVVTNAGKATVRGGEFDFNWRTPVDGLNLMGAFAYNRARYDVYTASCYTGQTIALGCNINPGPTGVFRAQDLADAPLARAPKYILSGGFDYRREVGAGMEIGVNANTSYSSSYYANPSLQASSRQGGYWLLDAGVNVAAQSQAWELAVIGRNLTNKRYITRSNDVTFTGGGTGTAAGILADTSAVPSRGREIMLRLTLKPGEFGR